MTEFEAQLLKTLSELKSVMIESNKGHVAIVTMAIEIKKILETFKKTDEPKLQTVHFLDTLPYVDNVNVR